MIKGLTSSQAAKLLKQFDGKIKDLLNNESKAATFVTAMGEDAEAVRPDYDYLYTQAELDRLQKLVLSLKHQINLFNATTYVGDTGMTIDQVLIMIPMLRAKTQKLSEMANRLPLERISGGYRANNIVEYTHTNYPISEAKADYDACCARLAELQLALDKTNSSVVFEVDLDTEF